MTPLHLGSLHPVEQVVVLLIAFGPFLLAGAVVFVVRRREIAAEEREKDLPKDDQAAR